MILSVLLQFGRILRYFLTLHKFKVGDLKMAAGRDDSVLDFYSGNVENNVEIRFVDEEKLSALFERTFMSEENIDALAKKIKAKMIFFFHENESS